MSYQNEGRTPDGQFFYRGADVLIEHASGHVLCGRVSEITTGDGGEVVIFPTADTGILNTMGGDPSKKVPDTQYLGGGFHHQSTKQLRVGDKPTSRFCFVHETPVFQSGGAPAPPKEVTQEVPADQGSNTAPLSPLPADKKADDPRDLDHDGTVSRKEEKQAQREHGSEGTKK